MAFLDNSGDIILDAVLTDAGRQRMARGDFRIVKFALGDEEINYKAFNADHPSGSAFYDLSIMQTPILEAFTNNTSLMRTKLVSINRNNVLFMPILSLNNNDLGIGESLSNSSVASYGGYYIMADDYTAKNGDLNGIVRNTGTSGVKFGTDANAYAKKTHILIDQGINGDGDLNIKTPFPSDLIETAYMVKVDHRLLTLQGFSNLENLSDSSVLNHSFVDDDGIATYYIAQGDPGFISATDRHVNIDDNNITEITTREEFAGPLGTRLAIRPLTSLNVRQSDGLFSEIGNAATGDANLTGANDIGAHKYIDTIINVVGVTTGYSLDLPVRILKKDR